MIVTKVFSRKEIKSDQSTISLFRKDKKRLKLINKDDESKKIKAFRLNLNELEIFNSKERKSLFEMNIAMIEALAFNMMSKRKNVSLFSITLKNVEKHFEKHSKSDTMIKDVFSSKYHEFLNVFDKKAFNIFALHRLYCDKKRMQSHEMIREKRHCR